MPEKTRDLATGSNYHFTVSDPYTPTSEQAPPLADNIRNPRWGDTPYDYVTWFDGLWHEGDPSRWGPEVFTKDAVMIDPTGTSTGGAIAASDFLLLFKYFPALRGEVVSWAHNDTEIMINWRFVVSNGTTVPVIDKFSFVKGLVSFRMAYFDTIALLSYLAENYGSGPLVDYFVDRFWQAAGGGGVVYLPGLMWALLKGIFLWSDVPLDAPTGLAAAVVDGRVALKWRPVDGAGAYIVKRSNQAGGTYQWIASDVQATGYVDQDVRAGAQYFYTVCAKPFCAPPPPTPAAGQRRRRRGPGSPW
ncbi:MAG TPA: nuclear transport factor 2 family protein [Thermoanaerobaculia bacterium]|nr:nuclear transport factor 2 family protein [Thermoanaerobaculia bacterium]